MNTSTKPTSNEAENGNKSKPLLDAVFGNSEEEIFKIQSKSVDIICIDPPYLYLKNQKLERKFDENLFFQQCYRILKNNGFIIMFGRGTSFYRWNMILDKLGLEFKEEIIWDKRMISSPLMPLSRVHETISIYGKGKAKINKVKIPYLEMKGFDFDSIINDIKRLKSVFKNTTSLDAVNAYLENKCLGFTENHTTKHKVQVEGHTKDRDRNINTINSVIVGLNEKSIISGTERKAKYNSTVQPSFLINEERKIATMKIIDDGMNEKSIIQNSRDHYSSIHPTQKPVRLLERLLQLCLPEKQKEEILVVDFFAGSFSCGEACYNLGVNFKGYEIDKEYFDLGNERLKKLQFQQRLF